MGNIFLDGRNSQFRRTATRWTFGQSATAEAIGRKWSRMAVSVQNQHIDVFGVLITPDIYRLGQYTNNDELKKLAILMYRSCGQLIDPYLRKPGRAAAPHELRPRRQIRAPHGIAGPRRHSRQLRRRLDSILDHRPLPKRRGTAKGTRPAPRRLKHRRITSRLLRPQEPVHRSKATEVAGVYVSRVKVRASWRADFSLAWLSDLPGAQTSWQSG